MRDCRRFKIPPSEIAKFRSRADGYGMPWVVVDYDPNMTVVYCDSYHATREDARRTLKSYPGLRIRILRF